METAVEYSVPLERVPVERTSAAVLSPIEQTPVLSIILPTRNEAGNIHLLLTRIERATAGIPTRVIFVDDSTDETPDVIREIADLFPLGAILLHRAPEDRIGGLGGAVVAGLHTASSPWICVMDADLQHPPELIPQLMDVAQSEDADLVIASRRAAQSNARALGPIREFISRTLDLIARLLFPSHLRHVSDPLTGFFLVRREALDLSALHPRGFKILMEILVRFPKLRVTEIPFDFGTRHAGKSKASPHEVFNYFSLLWTLRFGDDMSRFIRFALVGLSGIAVNTLALAGLTDVLGMYYMVSLAFATLASTVWNFALTALWVFDERHVDEGKVKRFSQFFFVNNLGLLVRGPIVFYLTATFGLYYLISNLISLLVLVILRYLLSDFWIWGKNRAKPSTGGQPAV